MNAEINEAVARKLLTVVDAGLAHGLGEPVPGEMCVEAAVCYALGLPHGDDPQCVAQAVRSLKIRLNDSCWSSNAARAAGMRRLALIQLGSAGALDELEFAKRVARLAIQTCVPAALRAAAGLIEQPRKDKLLNAADLCERDPTEKNSRAATAAARAANAAYAAATATAADAAAAATAYAAAYAAARAATAAAYAAAATAADAAAAASTAADAAARAEEKDKPLAEFAEGVVQILIDMKAPGSQWLFLTEAA